ncbi:MAG: LptA/OstA family protein [Limisphaerales bacterium]
MKKFHLIISLLVAGIGMMQAQTNTNTAPESARGLTNIKSEHGFFSNIDRQVIYTGNVRVDDPQMKLTCEQLIVDLAPSGGHVEKMTALTNVVMDSVDEKGETKHATSDKAVYIYDVVNGVTNETVTLTGNAKVKSGNNWMTGEPIIWNRANGSMTVENPVMLLHPIINNGLVPTNPPAVQHTNLSVNKTNFPPGTIQNIDKITNPKSLEPKP